MKKGSSIEEFARVRSCSLVESGCDGLPEADRNRFSCVGMREFYDAMEERTYLAPDPATATDLAKCFLNDHLVYFLIPNYDESTQVKTPLECHSFTLQKDYKREMDERMFFNTIWVLGPKVELNTCVVGETAKSDAAKVCRLYRRYKIRQYENDKTPFTRAIEIAGEQLPPNRCSEFSAVP